MSIKSVSQINPGYTVVTQHDPIVSLNHLSEILEMPIEDHQLTY